MNWSACQVFRGAWTTSERQNIKIESTRSAHTFMRCLRSTNVRSLPDFSSYHILGVGLLGGLLVVVLFARIRGGSLGFFASVACCMAWYENTSLQQSSKGSCSLSVSGHNLRADCQWHTLEPLLNCGANAALASVLVLV